MVKVNRPIIGICGRKQSGKDTVASMLIYILNAGVMRCSYREWYIKYKDKKNDGVKVRTVHFADYPKDICSRAFGIPREYFDNIDYKENKWYLMDKQTFVPKNKTIDNYIVATHAILSTSPLGALCSVYDGKVAITLRTLLQYVGTDIGRDRLGELCWIRPTISDAIDISNKYGFCIIPDVRFQNEANAIAAQANGLIIGISRPNSNDKKELEALHSSEQVEDITCNFFINNDKELMTLFYQVLNIVNEIIYNRIPPLSSSTGERP